MRGAVVRPPRCSSSKDPPSPPASPEGLNLLAGGLRSFAGTSTLRATRMKNRKRFAYRIDMWDDAGENVVEHLAGVEDLRVAMATYPAAYDRWPNAPITLRQGARVIEDGR